MVLISYSNILKGHVSVLQPADMFLIWDISGVILYISLPT